MPSPVDIWRNSSFDRTFAAAYDLVVERPALARPFGRALWGTDVDLLHRTLDPIRRAPPGSAILDVPCGGGFAFGALPRDFDGRYVAADLSAGMLTRARERADRLGLTQIEFLEADITALPFADASFDICACMSGLHCLADPGAALRELARCLTPGGLLVGNAVVTGEGARFDAVVRLFGAVGAFGPGTSHGALERLLAQAGFEPAHVQLSGAVAYFEASRARR